MPMDFGVGANLETALMLFENMSRKTGRTTALVEMARPGDMIIVPDSRTARIYENACRDAEKDCKIGWGSKDQITIVAVDLKKMGLNSVAPNQHGRVLFDHDFTLAIYRDAIKDAGKFLTRMEEALSKKPTTALADRAEEVAYHGPAFR